MEYAFPKTLIARSCNRVPARFQDLGEQQLKNIVHPLRVYAMRIGEHDDRIQAPAGASKPGISRHAERNVSDTTEHLELPQRVRVRAPGLRVELATAEKSIRFIDKNVPRELGSELINFFALTMRS